MSLLTRLFLILYFYLGIHLEGPFISKEKNGAHPVELIKDCTNLNSFEQIEDVYHSLDNVSIVTLAPESCQISKVISKLSNKGVVVSLGKECCWTVSTIID